MRVWVGDEPEPVVPGPLGPGPVGLGPLVPVPVALGPVAPGRAGRALQWEPVGLEASVAREPVGLGALVVREPVAEQRVAREQR